MVQEYAGPDSTKDPRPITERLKTLQQVQAGHCRAQHLCDNRWCCADCLNRKASGTAICMTRQAIILPEFTKVFCIPYIMSMLPCCRSA